MKESTFIKREYGIISIVRSSKNAVGCIIYGVFDSTHANQFVIEFLLSVRRICMWILGLIKGLRIENG